MTTLPFMRSLTGFGCGRAPSAVGEVVVQISAVNHKSLVVQLRGDGLDPAFEDELRTVVRTTAQRGTVSVHIGWSAATAPCDVARLEAAWLPLAALAQRLGAPAPTLDLAVRFTGTAATAPDPVAIRAALTQALNALAESRAREGAQLGTSLRSESATLRAVHGQMLAIASGRVERLRSGLSERISAALAASTAGTALLDPAILARELALHAERIDVSEELTRLTAHLDRLDVLLSHDGSGRELDFLAQEIGRELNTTGAKANDAALSALVIVGKLAMDRIKEQAANLL